MQQLLDQGVDVNARRGHYGSALWAALSPIERNGHYQSPKPSKEVTKVLMDAGARLYTMPSEAYSEEYIYQPLDMGSMTFERNAETPKPHSSRRQSCH